MEVWALYILKSLTLSLTHFKQNVKRSTYVMMNLLNVFCNITKVDVTLLRTNMTLNNYCPHRLIMMHDEITQDRCQNNMTTGCPASSDTDCNNTWWNEIKPGHNRDRFILTFRKQLTSSFHFKYETSTEVHVCCERFKGLRSFRYCLSFIWSDLLL